MPANSTGETGSTAHTLKLHDADAVLPFPSHGLTDTVPVLQIKRSAIGAYAPLGKPSNLMCNSLSFAPSSTDRHHLLASADLQAFLRRHLAAGEDNLHGAPLSDQPRQADRSTVEQRNSPTPAIHANVRRFLHDAYIAPKGEFHAAGNRWPGDGRNNRFVELEPGRTKRTARWQASILREIEILKGPVTAPQ